MVRFLSTNPVSSLNTLIHFLIQRFFFLLFYAACVFSGSTEAVWHRSKPHPVPHAPASTWQVTALRLVHYCCNQRAITYGMHICGVNAFKSI